MALTGDLARLMAPLSPRILPAFLVIVPTLVGFLTVLPAAAQTGGVEGRVREVDGTPVFAAAVVVSLGAQSPGLRGTESNRLGFYRIGELPVGEYRVEVIRLGYEQTAVRIRIVAGQRTELNLTLTRAAVEVEGVSVEAVRSRERARFLSEAGITSRELVGEELKLIPGLAEADPIRAIEVLPGVISTSDFSSAFNVRGGSADQNLILLDGVPIFNPFHLGGLFSVFNADMVSRAELQSGGFPAEYGGRVSSVLNIDTDAGDGSFRGDAAVSFLASRLAVGGSLPEGLGQSLGFRSTRWRVSARRSYFDVVLAPIFEFPYHLTDLQGSFEAWTAGGSRLSITAYSGKDDLNLTNLDEDDFPLRISWDWGNDIVGARWTMPLGGGGSLEVRSSYSHFGTELGFPDFDDSRFRSGITQASGGVHVEERVGSRWTMKTGVEVNRFDYDNLAVSGGTEFGRGLGDGLLGSAYIQGRWQDGSAWLLEVGGRVDGWKPSPGESEVALSPRLSVKRFFLDGDAAVKLSVGRFSQFLHSLRNEDLPIGLDIWVLSGERAPRVDAEHYQLGVEGYLTDSWFTSLEGYYRRFDGVITTNVANDPNDDLDDLLPGTGVSWGVDGFIRKSGAGLSGWLSLSYLRAERTFPDFLSGLDPTPDVTFPPIFDRRLDVDLVLRKPMGWGVTGGLRWNVGTGLPHTRPLGSFAYFQPRFTSAGRFVWQSAGQAVNDSEGNAIALGPRNGERYPLYHRLDVSFRKTILKPWGRMTPYVDILNVYNRKNVLFYFYELNETPPIRSGISMFPMLPTFGMEVTF